MTVPSHARLFVVCAVLGLASAGQVAAAPVTVISAQVVAEAYDGSLATNQDFSTAFGMRTLSSTQGGSSSTTSIDWQDTGSGALFDFGFNQRRVGSNQDYAYGNSVFSFTVGLNNTTYSLSGLYSMTGPASLTWANVGLFDLTNNSTLFQDLSESRNTANEIFSLGVAGDGDFNNGTVGSLTGSLVAGRQYLFAVEYLIQTTPGGLDNGATGTGCATLSIGGATADARCGVASVPEPGSLALVGLALAALGLARHKTRFS